MRKKIFFIILCIVPALFLIYSVKNLEAAETKGSDSQSTQTRQQTLAEIQRRLRAIAIEVARLAAGLPPNIKGGAYPGLEQDDSSGTTGKNDRTGGDSTTGGNTGGAGGTGGDGGQSVSGGGGGANQPFGGQITSVNYTDCDCSQHQKIQINPAKSDLPRTVLYNSSSRLYAEYQLQTNRYLLGWYNTYAVCMKRATYYCYSNGTFPLIAGVGTSGAGGGTGTIPPEDNEEREDDDSGDPPEQSTSTPPSDKCNQETLAGWRFNAGIQNQVGDASASLKALLYCVCNKMKQTNTTGLITSISDNHHIGRLYECRNPSTYYQCGSGTKCCYHSRTSCHYGGDKNDNKSYAADLGMSGAALTKKYVAQCGGSVLDEGNHLHIATRDCRE